MLEQRQRRDRPPRRRANYNQYENFWLSVQAAFCAAALLFSTASHASGETLREALGAAFRDNPGLRAERARQRADEENVRQAIAGWLPTIILGADEGRAHSRTEPPVTTDTLNPHGIGVTLSQPLFRGFRTLNGKRKAEAEVQAGRFQLDDREQAILLDAVTAYVDVLRDRKIARLRRDNVTYLRSEVNASRVRRRAGELSKTDVAQARARLHEGKADLALALAEEKASEARYVSVVGHAPGRLAPPQLPENLIPRSLKEAEALADAQNPGLESARSLQVAARHEKRQAYGEWMPTVSLEAAYRRDHDPELGIDARQDSSILLRLAMPLYQGGSVRSRIRQTTAREMNRRYEVADMRRRTRAEVTDAWQKSQAARRRIAAARLQVAAAREALNGIEIEAEVGERAFFEVLDAQRELVNAEVALARSERDLTVASYTLLAAVGRLRAHLFGIADSAGRDDAVQTEPQVRGWRTRVEATQRQAAAEPVEPDITRIFGIDGLAAWR